jgi:hypothetical protein
MLTSSTRPTGPAGFTSEYAEPRPRLALGDVVLYGGDTPQCLRLKNLFCSELVAATYQRLGLLPTEPPSNNYTPRDFGAEGKLPLRQGAALGEEVMLHW